MSIVRSMRVLGSQLRRRRRLLGLSQAAVGELTSLRQATISSLENGDGGTLESIFAVLSALKLEIDLLERSSGGDDLGTIF